ncbi:MAG: hypothetical protein N2C14_31065 [Planctomycetales bacterium]
MSQQSAELSGGALRLRFFQEGGRFAHALFLADDANGIDAKNANDEPLMVSVEGDADLIWPPSPPFQDLLVESIGQGRAAMLVGMAGKSHWSASFETRENGFFVDVACRVKQSPEQLGSAYRIRAENSPTLSENVLRISVPGIAGRLLISPQSVDGRPILIGQPSSETATETWSLRLSSPPTEGTCTCRWQYAIRWET